MRSYLLLTENGPLLTLTGRSSITEGALVDHLEKRGVAKFIAFEVPVSKVKKAYGVPFEVVASDISQGREVRVLDYNGQHIFSKFSFDDLGSPTLHED